MARKDSDHQKKSMSLLFRGKAIFKPLNTGRIDEVISDVSISSEREEKYDFTDPYLYIYRYVVTMADSDISTVEDLNGKKFLCCELSAGQMIDDVKLSVENKHDVYLFSRWGSVLPSPKEVREDNLTQP